MNHYTVQIEAGNAEGTVWQALQPAENISDPGPADQVALDVLTNQNVLALDDNGPWRIVVWNGDDADTSAEPAHILDEQQFHDAVADHADVTAADAQRPGLTAAQFDSGAEIEGSVDEPASTPPVAWTNLISALQLMAKHPAHDTDPTYCEHDKLIVLADDSLFTPEEIAQLEAWDFFVNAEGGFKSFKYGNS